MKLRPIGTVKRTGESSRLEINPVYAGALEGCENLASIDVLYWMHELSDDDRSRLKVHPRGDRARPKRGVFALRSPMRPNPIGVSTVRVLRREGTVLIVSGLDANDASPIIDIKAARS